MASGLEGDWDELDALVERLGDLPEAPAIAIAKAAPRVQRKAREGYVVNRGPGGASWPRNTSNNRFPSLARPASGVTFSAEGNALVGEGEDVLEYHLGADRGGNPKLPARAVFPEDGDVPPEWEVEVEKAFGEELDR